MLLRPALGGHVFLASLNILQKKRESLCAIIKDRKRERGREGGNILCVTVCNCFFVTHFLIRRPQKLEKLLGKQFWWVSALSYRDIRWAWCNYSQQKPTTLIRLIRFYCCVTCGSLYSFKSALIPLILAESWMKNWSYPQTQRSENQLRGRNWLTGVCSDFVFSNFYTIKCTKIGKLQSVHLQF